MFRLRFASVAWMAFAILAALPLGGGARAQDVLLVPLFGTTANPARVAAFNPLDGSLINANFIAPDGRLRQPLNAISTGNGTILISDQLAHSIFEYDLNGQYLRTLTDTASSGIQAPRGMQIHNGELYVVVGTGTYADTVQRFDLGTGARLGTFASGFTRGQDILIREDDVLVSGFTSNTIYRYSLGGANLGPLVTGITGAYQMQNDANGNLLVGSFANPGGVYTFAPNGAPLGSQGSGFVRGPFRLDNGDLFYTQNNAVTVVDHLTGTLTNVAGAGNWQYVERVSLTAIPEPGTLALLGLGLLPLARRRR